MNALCCVNRVSPVHLLVDNFRSPSRYRVISITELAMKVAHIGSQAIYMWVRRQVLIGKFVAISLSRYLSVALI